MHKNEEDKIDELEEPGQSEDEQQQDYSDSTEKYTTEPLDDDQEINTDDSKYYNHDKIIPPEYNDQEYDQLSKTEQIKIVRNNIISVIAFFIFFLIILGIIL